VLVIGMVFESSSQVETGGEISVSEERTRCELLQQPDRRRRFFCSQWTRVQQHLPRTTSSDRCCSSLRFLSIQRVSIITLSQTIDQIIVTIL